MGLQETKETKEPSTQETEEITRILGLLTHIGSSGRLESEQPRVTMRLKNAYSPQTDDVCDLVNSCPVNQEFS